MANKIDDPGNSSRTERWEKYRQHLEGLEGHLTADAELKPGSKAYDKLKALSDRLAEVQEKDFEARQLKQEIDQALANAGVGGLVEAFKSIAQVRRDDDSFE